MVYQKTAIQHGSSTLTSRVDPATSGSSFVMNLVEDGANSAHAFATFSGATNELTLQTSLGTKGILNANVIASQVTTAEGSVTDGTNTLTLQPSILQFNSDATIASSGGTLTVENLLISDAEISNANLVLSGSNSIHLNTSELIIGNGLTTGGKIVSSSTENGDGVLTINPSPDDNRGSLVIKGDLTVQGTTTTVNSTEITIADAILELNGGNPAADSGLRVNREGSTDVEFLWDQSEDYWTVGTKSIKAATFIGNVTGTVSSLSNHTTSDLTEGTNQYYTDARARAALSVTDNGGDGLLAYNSSTGVLTYTGPSATEVRAHFSGGTGVTLSGGVFAIGQSVGVTDNVTFNTVTADVTGDVTGTVSDLSNHTTSDLTEGINQYYTDARARAALSVTDNGGDGLLAYNSSTGVLSYTGPSATEVRAHFSAGTGVTLSDGEIAIGQSVGTTDNVTFASVTANVTGTVSDLSNHTTSDLAEGTNKYYTDIRARNALSVTDNGGDGSLDYNSTSGLLTYTGPSATEVRAHFSGGTGVTLTDGEFAIGQSVGTTDNVTFASVTASLTGDVTGTVSDLSNHSTSDLTEGTNQYYTDARARAALSVTDNGGDGSLDYDSTSGVLSYTGPSATEVRAHFSGGTGVTLTDGEFAIGQPVGTTDNVTFATVTADLTGDVTGDVTGTVSDLSNHTTTDLTEGTNQYYTDSRARAALSVTDNGGDGSLGYNSTSGVLTYTGPSATEVRAHFSAGPGVTLSAGEVSLGAVLTKRTVGPTTTLTQDLSNLLTAVGSTPFRNATAGGAVTLYVSAGNKTTPMISMGVYHAVLVNGVLNVVSQLEVNEPTGTVLLNVDNTTNQLTIKNNDNVAIHLSLRAVVQFDNFVHLV
jgi:hypothetical protein